MREHCIVQNSQGIREVYVVGRPELLPGEPNIKEMKPGKVYTLLRDGEKMSDFTLLSDPEEKKGRHLLRLRYCDISDGTKLVEEVIRGDDLGLEPHQYYPFIWNVTKRVIEKPN
ncbi:MAG: hypothetical protein A2152_01595 [Candidatus Levybacteria bacterium RBG_16_35_6]|nr:MAG: hypothetical protein A2152_01595 [Candidatus Levybacteria bacterium RBG_16_35_6]